MLIVGKGYVDRSARPPELQRPEGFLFYSRDDENDVSAITSSFNRASATTGSTPLGRKGQFAFRGLIAGPPPASHMKKSTFPFIFQDGEFHKVIDLVEKGPPTAQLLADLTAAPSSWP